MKRNYTYPGLVIFFSIICIGIALPSKAQDSLKSFVKARSYTGPVKDFEVDILGNLYLLNETGDLKKISAEGDSLAAYNNVKQYGKLSSINVTNPLKILLYYRQFATIVVLDRYLSKRNVINLRKQNIFSVNVIAPSYDNNVWVFDEQNNKLLKIGDDGKVLSESNDFRMIFDSVPTPTKIIDRDGFVYLFDPNKGVYIFDYYGAFKQRLAFYGWKDFEVSGKTVYGFDETFYYVQKDKLPDTKRYALPLAFSSFERLKPGNDKVYLLTQGRIDVYQLK